MSLALSDFPALPANSQTKSRTNLYTHIHSAQCAIYISVPPTATPPYFPLPLLPPISLVKSLVKRIEASCSCIAPPAAATTMMQF